MQFPLAQWESLFTWTAPRDGPSFSPVSNQGPDQAAVPSDPEKETA
jgi:hypothetical protein